RPRAGRRHLRLLFDLGVEQPETAPQVVVHGVFAVLAAGVQPHPPGRLQRRPPLRQVPRPRHAVRQQVAADAPPAEGGDQAEVDDLHHAVVVRLEFHVSGGRPAVVGDPGLHTRPVQVLRPLRVRPAQPVGPADVAADGRVQETAELRRVHLAADVPHVALRDGGRPEVGRRRPLHVPGGHGGGRHVRKGTIAGGPLSTVSRRPERTGLATCSARNRPCPETADRPGTGPGISPGSGPPSPAAARTASARTATRSRRSPPSTTATPRRRSSSGASRPPRTGWAARPRRPAATGCRARPVSPSSGPGTSPSGGTARCARRSAWSRRPRPPRPSPPGPSRAGPPASGPR